MVVCLSHLALIFVLLVSHTASGIPQKSTLSNNHYVERAAFGNWPAINTYRGALLVKNGQQTSCEFALIDQRSAFIAASCLDLKPGSTAVEDSTRHEIFFDNAKGLKATKSPIPAGDIHVHPNYDPATYANNIAVVIYTMDQKRIWTNAVSVNRDEWTNALFVRRYLESEKSMNWRSPTINSGAWGGFAGCATASGIYSSNQRDFVCSTDSTPMIAAGDCRIPFSSVYGIVPSNMAIAALHSHTVVEGTSMCGAKQTFHYYTVLAGYVGFAQKVVGYDIVYFTASGDFSSNIDANYKMQPPAFGIPKGLRLFGGDAFVPGPGVPGTDEVPPLPPPSPPPPPPPSPLPTPALPSAAPSVAPSVAPEAPAPEPPTPGASSPGVPKPDVPAPNIPPASTTKTRAPRPPPTNAGAGDRPQEVATDDSGPVEEEEQPDINDANPGAKPSRPPSTTLQTLSNGSVVPVVGNGNGNAGMLSGGAGQGGAMLGNNRESQVNNGGSAAANNDSSDDDDGGGLASGQIVAIGIFVPIAFIGMLIGGYYGMRWYRRRRLERNWNASEVQQIVDTQMTENELGLGSNPANFQLPSYRDYGGTMLIATSSSTTSL
ncbi:hypothetical protein GGH94_003111 [Coemansia aciculifera]|uniref:Peptidase S1 domain-containing protein n=1 Tax=Coemansia aciculifera TaxID=417176 RepID=A0A9W8IKP5_9FUNG|nr:hypothetical protein GGH94_003111 [Coemansia aciculifera]